jgi:hypothetical protein
MVEAMIRIAGDGGSYLRLQCFRLSSICGNGSSMTTIGRHARLRVILGARGMFSPVRMFGRAPVHLKGWHNNADRR